jgi:hypothetical protein
VTRPGPVPGRWDGGRAVDRRVGGGGRWSSHSLALAIEQIARPAGHACGSAVTETVYRKQLRPIIDDGATVMNRVFPTGSGSHPASHSTLPKRTNGLVNSFRRSSDQAVRLWAILGSNQ